MRVVQGGPAAFQAMVSPNTYYAPPNVSAFMEGLTDAGKEFYNKTNNFFNTSLANVRKMKTALKEIGGVGGLMTHPTAVYEINEVEGLLTPSLAMQRWIMCQPNLKGMWNDGLETYSGYTSTEDVGNDDYDYRRVYNSIVRHEDDYDYIEEHIEHIVDKERDILTIEQQADIIATHEYIKTLIDAEELVLFDEDVDYY